MVREVTDEKLEGYFHWLQVLGISELAVTLTMVIFLLVYFYMDLINVDTVEYYIFLFNFLHIITWTSPILISCKVDTIGFFLAHFALYVIVLLLDVSSLIWRYFILIDSSCTWLEELHNRCNTSTFLVMVAFIINVMWIVFDVSEIVLGTITLRSMASNMILNFKMKQDEKRATEVLEIVGPAIQKLQQQQQPAQRHSTRTEPILSSQEHREPPYTLITPQEFAERNREKNSKEMKKTFQKGALKRVLSVMGILDLWSVIMLIIVYCLIVLFNADETRYLVWFHSMHFFMWMFTFGIANGAKNKDLFQAYVVIEVISLVGDCYAFGAKWNGVFHCWRGQCSLVDEIILSISIYFSFVLAIISVIQATLVYLLLVELEKTDDASSTNLHTE